MSTPLPGSAEQAAGIGFVAQTNLQLYRQLHDLGYSSEALARARAVYEFATTLFAGRFRPCGRTFIAHLVGTASILAELGATGHVVTAGLIHAAYEQGDFGFTRWRYRRGRVREAVGAEVEQLIWRYNGLEWYGGAIVPLSERLDTLDMLDRFVVLMRLANELDDHMNFAHELSGELHYDRQADRELVAGMAERLGYARLAAALREAFGGSGKVDWVEPLRTDRTGSYQLAWSRGRALRKVLGLVPTRYLPF